MITTLRKAISAKLMVAAAVVLVAGCGTMGLPPLGAVSLSGAQEVPAVVSAATGAGNIKVATDRSVTGAVTTTGISATAAHIHMAPKGSNGPVIVTLSKTAEGTWSVPAGAKLTDTQYADYVAGNMYINVHSAAYPAGEIRGQLISN